MEAQSGRILYAEDPDDGWHPASLTKIMTAYVVFQALKSGKVKLETKFPHSEAAAAQPPSKLGLPVGAELEVGTALRALIIKSANDVAVLLAEGIGGTEAQFVEEMNATAKRLGMTRTHYVNANGLPAAEQVTSARDLARLARAAYQDFPEYASYWSAADMRVGRIRLVTHNGLLKTYEGTDGMKTGFICDSGYNIVASATRDGTRLIAVVLGAASGNDRTLRTQALLEHGFNTHAWKQVFDTPNIDTLPYMAEAKDAISIRQTVMASECGWRRRAVSRVVQARAKARQQQRSAAAKTDAPASGDAAAATKAAVGAPASATKATPKKASQGAQSASAADKGAAKINVTDGAKPKATAAAAGASSGAAKP
jgi:D-alanyl-D-alanine carboxypeptidase